MRCCFILVLALCLLVGCGGPPTPTPDVVATQVTQQLAVAATLTASAQTVVTATLTASAPTVVTATLTALALTATNTPLPTGRGSLTPVEAIQGHWRDKTQTDYYVATKTILVVENDGTRTNMTYTVLESNPEHRWVKIQVAAPAGEQMRMLRIAPDGKNVVETIYLFGKILATENWKYIDDKTMP